MECEQIATEATVPLAGADEPAEQDPGRARRLLARLRPLLERARAVERTTMLLLALLGVLFALLGGALWYLAPEGGGDEVALDRLSELTEQRRVASATFLDEDARIVGTLRGQGGGEFHVTYPGNDVATAGLIARLTEAGARVAVDSQTAKSIVRLLATALIPLMILANLFALFFTAGRAGGSEIGELAEFGSVDKEGRTGGSVTFADVAGVQEAQTELQEVVDYLQSPQRYAHLGAIPPKGVLLFGPPGCGKTLLAKAVAGEAQVPFFSTAGAEFVESLVGVGAARVRDLFEKVRAAAPAILFIDEIDAAGRRRGAGGSGGGSEERDQTLNQMLVEMDGFEASAGIVVMGATNRPDILDPALLRPGRFDRHVTVEPPDLERREQILGLHAGGRPLAADVDLTRLARQTPGFTGADLASVINEAALLTVREGRAELGAATLSEAVQRVLGGPQQRGHLLTDDERRRVAHHEAGHAVVAGALGRAGDVHRVSIVARGRGLGSAAMGRQDDAAVHTARDLRGRIVVALAGRAAEERAFGDASTGSADDLERATRMAREMAGRYGMSEQLGLATLLAPASDFLGDQALPAGISGTTHAALDAEVRSLLDEARKAAGELLERHADELEALAERLLADETVEGASLLELLPEATPSKAAL